MSMGFSERKRWTFLGLPFTFTKYTITEEVITVNTGFIKKKENDCYLYKVQDVEHCSGFFERLFGMGDIRCFTGDTTHPELLIENVRHSKEIKNFILEASEVARRKRRTLNTLDISTGNMDTLDDLDF